MAGGLTRARVERAASLGWATALHIRTLFGAVILAYKQHQCGTCVICRLTRAQRSQAAKSDRSAQNGTDTERVKTCTSFSLVVPQTRRTQRASGAGMRRMGARDTAAQRVDFCPFLYDSFVVPGPYGLTMRLV